MRAKPQATTLFHVVVDDRMVAVAARKETKSSARGAVTHNGVSISPDGPIACATWISGRISLARSVLDACAS